MVSLLHTQIRHTALLYYCHLVALCPMVIFFITQHSESKMTCLINMKLCQND